MHITNKVEYTIKQNRRPSTSFLGNSDLESDNIQSLSIPHQKHLSKSTYGQDNAEQLLRQGEAGTLQGPTEDEHEAGVILPQPDTTNGARKLPKHGLPPHGKGCLGGGGRNISEQEELLMR